MTRREAIFVALEPFLETVIHLDLNDLDDTRRMWEIVDAVEAGIDSESHS